MIESITGRIDGVELRGSAAAMIRPEGGLCYRVLLTAFTASRLVGEIGSVVTLHAVHWLDSQDQGTSFTPRLAGFARPEDRDFYELLTSCKGLGKRRALKAMALDTARLAAAIADRDLATLQALPEIGRRLAETIVATLHGKVDAFVSAAAYSTAGPSSSAADAAAGPASVGKRKRGTNAPTPDDAQVHAAAERAAMSREALEALMQLGEDRLTAIRLIDRALSEPHERPATTQQLLAKVFAVRGSV